MEQLQRPRVWLVAVAAVTLLGLGLRSGAIDRHSFWYDEAVTAGLIQASYADLFQGRARDNGNPPGFLLLARAWADLLGRSETALRWLPVLCGTLAIPLLALLGRRLLNPVVGLLAAALLAVSPLAIELSNEVRTYAWVQLLAVAATWLLVRWLERPRGLELALYAVCVFLGGYSHYYAWAVPLTHLVGLAVVPATRRRVLPVLAAVTAASVLWTAIWLPSFREQLAQPGNLQRGGERWQVQFLATPVVFSWGRTLAWREASPLVLSLVLLAAVAAFVTPACRGIVHALRRQPLAGVWLSAWFLLPILGPLAVAVLWKPIFFTRYAAVGLPACLLLVALGLTTLRPRSRILLGGVLLGLTALSLSRYFQLPLKDDWRAAVPAVLSQLQPGQPVLIDRDHEVASFKHYAAQAGEMPGRMIGLVDGPGRQQTLQGVRFVKGQRVDRKAADCTGEVLTADEVCLICCVPNGSPEAYEELFRQHGFVRSGSQHFHRIDVFFYSRPAAWVQMQPNPQR